MSQYQLFHQDEEPRQEEGLPDDDVFHTPFGPLKMPINTEHDQERVDRLVKIVEKASDIERMSKGMRRGVLWYFIHLWYYTVNRYKEGSETEYMKLVEEMPRDMMDLAKEGFHILLEHFFYEGYLSDILGALFMECANRWGGKWSDQEFTPWEVCSMMATMQVQDMDADRLRNGPAYTVHDPACGSGSFFLAMKAEVAGKYGRRACRNLSFSGQDIDAKCVCMADIQLKLSDPLFVVNLMGATAGDMKRQQQAK